ncbi:prostaglandin F2 receptor negative regulator isoform X2 [Rousettus aegyptiacus]|uniref:Prostaglandin F2 receptor negative regulator n=1 Tax=Rousettus aegyptiacus TaxID=9407 RepID=A0A7J8BGW9_ROUAE|nr:prostaglandin F2 receptor negative regulator isoform X2 [Rousettus aegyptiacus]KAF6397729.1 prostaglandin F2 receptor inhibitor [Rousettus aegyptiacus]
MGRPAPRPLLLLLLLLLALCRGRVVRVPAGSLVRVAGTELVIPCNVSDYDGPSEQNFDWSFSSSGSSFVELASTWEVGFPAQLYQERLQRGEILLRRTANDAVELHIKNVQPSDQGHYKCSTPSTDATVQGNYEDTVQVKVLADALRVAASPPSAGLSLRQGEPLELRCVASTASPLHTHLALLWEVRHRSSRQSVVALTHEGRLRPGAAYEQRYHSGDVRLDTVGSDGYRLSVSRVLAEDQGTYRCVVSEWIEEQGSWQEIQEKAVDVATVVIQPTVLRAAVSRNVSVTEGKELDLACNITTDRADDVRPEVTWYFSRTPDSTWPGPHVLARLDRESLAHSSPRVALSHVGARSYHLLVRDVSRENSGHYFCHVALWAPGHNRSWHKVAEAMSVPASVDVTWLEPDYQVYLNASKVPECSDDLTELECRIVGAKNVEASVRFAVSWFYRRSQRSDDVATSELLAAMDGDWTLGYGERSKQRAQDGDFIFSKEHTDTFSFRIQRTTEEDRGDYYCVVSAWARQRNDSWAKSKDVVSKPVHIFWASEDSVLVVKARQPKPFFAAGNTFEMTCKVSSKNIKSPRYSVLITAEKPVGDLSSPNETKYIISLDQDSVVKLENWTDASRVDGVVLEKVQEDEFRYRMYQTQVSDAGLYRCLVTAWSPVRGSLWREAATSLSNPIEIDFQTSGPIFNASVYSDTPSVIRGELIKLLCIITVEGTALDPDDMAFDVSWFAVHSFGLDKAPVLLSSLDRKGIVHTAPRDRKSDLSLERVGELEFLLQVHSSEDQDFGNYYCSVTPWVKSPIGSWQKEAEIFSKPVFITVKMDVLNAFKYPLLIGAGLSAVIGLLSCLIGYCSSRWCCKKEIQETRRERRRLMSMEMD